MSGDSAWKQIHNYCKNFGRSHLLQPYLLGEPPPNTIRDTYQSSMEEKNTIGDCINENNQKNKHRPEESFQFNLSDITSEFDKTNAESIHKSDSPDDSVASRKLEWDSLGDVGYSNTNQNTESLSTLERLAIEKHCKTNAVINVKDSSEICFTSPNAKSTPIVKLLYPKDKTITLSLKRVSNNNRKETPKSQLYTLNSKLKLNTNKNIGLKSNFSSHNTKNETTVTVESPVDESKEQQQLSIDSLSTKNKEIQTTVRKCICSSSQTSYRKTEQSQLNNIHNEEINQYQLINHDDNKNLIKQNNLDSNSSDTPRNNVYTNIELINKLINTRYKDPEIKQKLRSKIMNILDDIDYFSDSNSSISKQKYIPKAITNGCQTEILTQSLEKSSETQRELKRIDMEILNLLMTKTKLESKHNPAFQNILSSNTIIDTNYIPPLNIQTSREELPSTSTKPIQMSNKSKASSSSSYSKSEKNDFMSDTSLVTSTSSSITIKKFKSKFENAPNRSPKKIRSNINSKSILEVCPCCKSKLLNVFVSNKTNDTETLPRGLQEMKKAFDIFKNCKVMKLLMKDYEALIMKYHLLKHVNSKISEKSSIINSVTSSNSSDNSVKTSNNQNISNKSSVSTNKTINQPTDNNTLINSKTSDLKSESTNKTNASIHNISENKDLVKDLYILMKKLENFMIVNENEIKSESKSQQSSSKTNISHTRTQNSKRDKYNNSEKKNSYDKSTQYTLQNQNKIKSGEKLSSVSSEEIKNKISISPLLSEKSKNTTTSKKSVHKTSSKMCSDSNVKKNIPGSVAYNLEIVSSDSVIKDNSSNCRRTSLENVIIKVPFKKFHSKNDNRALCYFSSNQSNEEISTSEQLKELSSLIDDYSPLIEENDNHSSSNMLIDINNKVPENYKNKILSLQEYLFKNRPEFINNADKRWDIIKKLNHLRKKQNIEKRQLLESELLKYSKMKNFSESELIKLISSEKLLTVDRRLFNTKEMVRNTAEKFRKLPEFVNKQNELKKKEFKKTNRFLTNIFVKRLQQKTLKGIVNYSYNSMSL